MRIKKPTPLLFLPVFLALCAGLPRAANRYADPDLGFSIEFPYGWMVQAIKDNRDTATIGVAGLSPLDTQPLMAVAVGVDNLPPGIGLEMYCEVFLGVIKARYEGYREFERTRARLAGLPARRVVFSYRQEQVDLKAICYITVKADKGYSLTCLTALEDFDRAVPVFEGIISSFRLDGARAPQEMPTETPAETQPLFRLETGQRARPGEKPGNADGVVPQARTAAPEPPRFLLAVEQDGRPVKVAGHAARLKKAPFTLILTFNAPMGVLVNISTKNASFEAARTGRRLGEIPGFTSLGFIEGYFNEARAVRLSEHDYHYWYYQHDGNHRFDKTELNGGRIVCRRTVAAFSMDDKELVLPIAHLPGNTLYLVFLLAERPSPFRETVDQQREYLRLSFR